MTGEEARVSGCYCSLKTRLGQVKKCSAALSWCPGELSLVAHYTRHTLTSLFYFYLLLSLSTGLAKCGAPGGECAPSVW